jgi:hypothetical protein
MKILQLLTAIAALALASVGSAAPGHDHSHEETPEWAELFGDASLPIVWQSITASAEKITATVTTQKSEGVADWAETIHLAAHALIDQVELPDIGRKKRLDAALAQAAQLADEVLDAAQHDEIDHLAAAYKRLQSALLLAQSRLPKEITEASPETPRFAKAGEHSDHAH